MRSPQSVRDRKLRKCRVELSDQWRSSIASRTRRSWARPSRSASSASKTLDCEASPPLPTRLPSPGRTAVRAARSGSGSASNAGWPSRSSGRSAPSSGAYGSSPSPSSTQSPTSTRAPRSRARPVSSSSRRDFPTPDSPATSTSEERPSAASCRAASSSASWPARPTKRALVIRVAIVACPSCHPMPSRLALREPRDIGHSPTCEPYLDEGRAVRLLPPPEADPHDAREHVLDVRAVEDGRALPEVPAVAGGGVRRLGAPRRSAPLARSLDDRLAVVRHPHLGRFVGNGSAEAASGGLAAARVHRLRLAVEARGHSPIDLEVARLHRGHRPPERLRLAGRQRAARPRVDVGRVTPQRRCFLRLREPADLTGPPVDHELGPLGIRQLRIGLPEVEPVHSDRDVRDGVLTGVADGDDQIRALGELLVLREARAHHLDGEIALGLVLVLALCAAAADTGHHSRQRKRAEVPPRSQSWANIPPNPQHMRHSARPTVVSGDRREHAIGFLRERVSRESALLLREEFG